MRRSIRVKGTAFDDQERTALGLKGLLPPQVESLQQQSVRAYESFNMKETDLERHIYLRQLQDSNEILFYRLLLDHIEEMMPIVYTPTVGLACQQFSHIYRRPRGLIVSYPLRDSIAEVLGNRPNPEVDVIVVTDGERILGLGDQGVGASKVAGKSVKEHEIVFVGAGSAAIGVADYLRIAMVEEGLAETEAQARFWIIDKDGLLDDDRRDLSEEQKPYARERNETANWPRNQHGQVGLEEVINKVEATVLIGLSTVKGIFSESIVREMARKTKRPIIFPLSNPTSRSEAKPSDLLAWTEGRALIATGSPFAPVKYGGRSIEIAQCNNVFIFPAVGLALLASDARRVSDKMMLAGAKALGEHSPALRDPAASLLPRVRSIRENAVEVAYAVARKAQEEGFSSSVRTRCVPASGCRKPMDPGIRSLLASGVALYSSGRRVSTQGRIPVRPSPFKPKAES